MRFLSQQKSAKQANLLFEPSCFTILPFISGLTPVPLLRKTGVLFL